MYTHYFSVLTYVQVYPLVSNTDSLKVYCVVCSYHIVSKYQLRLFSIILLTKMSSGYKNVASFLQKGRAFK